MKSYYPRVQEQIQLIKVAKGNVPWGGTCWHGPFLPRPRDPPGTAHARLSGAIEEELRCASAIRGPERDTSRWCSLCPLSAVLSLSVWSETPFFRLGIAEGLNSGTECGLWRPVLSRWWDPPASFRWVTLIAPLTVRYAVARTLWGHLGKLLFLTGNLWARGQRLRLTWFWCSLLGKVFSTNRAFVSHLQHGYRAFIKNRCLASV